MRNAVAVIMLLLVAVTSTQPVLAGEGAEGQVGAIPNGARMELRLKDKQKLRGFKGTASASGFKFVDQQGGEREVAYADVVSAKAIGKSHLTRNVVIIVAVGVAILAAVVGIEYARCGPLGCGKI